MTENKRFTTRNGVFYIDNETGWEFKCYGEVAELLNELSEENKELKKEVNEWTQKYVDEMESHACTYRELDSIKQTLDDWKLDFDNVKETVRNGQGRVIGIYYYI